MNLGRGRFFSICFTNERTEVRVVEELVGGIQQTVLGA